MSVPHGNWKTTSFVAGLKTAGTVGPFVIDDPINRDSFEVQVERVLVLELTPSDIIILENLLSYLECIREASA